MSLIAVFLGGCDDTPNPNFERDLQAQQAGPYDPYVQLFARIPRYEVYRSAPAATRASVAMQELQMLRDGYVPLLTHLKQEQPIAGLNDLTNRCVPLFMQAGELSTDTSIAAKDARAKADPLLTALAECREAAIAAEGDGDDQETVKRANVFRRFASSAMLLVSVSVTARGDESGVELWQRNVELMLQDKPGFKIHPGMFFDR